MRAHRHRKRQIERHGFKFDNSKELERYEYLRLEERAGIIRDIAVHPEFPIFINGRTVARYIADFSYVGVATGRQIIEDCKPGYNKKKSKKRKGIIVQEWTERAPLLEPLYILKKKLVEALYEIQITEIWK